jgi:hypothetical protein
MFAAPVAKGGAILLDGTAREVTFVREGRRLTMSFGIARTISNVLGH